jgi:hypothetical protein
VDQTSSTGAIARVGVTTTVIAIVGGDNRRRRNTCNDHSRQLISWRQCYFGSCACAWHVDCRSGPQGAALARGHTARRHQQRPQATMRGA